MGIETKINFYSQPAQEIIKQLEDGFAKASRLAGLDAAPPVFLVHAVADLWCDSENDRAAQHNNVVTMHSYKRFRVQDPKRDRATSPNGRQKSVKRWIFDNSEWTECPKVCSHPEESTLSIPEEGQSVSGTRLRIWIAQVKKPDKQYQLEFIRANETCIETQLLSETEVNEILARNNKKNKKPIRWLPNKPKTKT